MEKNVPFFHVDESHIDTRAKAFTPLLSIKPFAELFFTPFGCVCVCMRVSFHVLKLQSPIGPPQKQSPS